LIVIDVPRLVAESCLRHVEWLEQVDSTNDRALLIASQAVIESPLLIGAEEQSAGRGRGANRWWGAEGSLMFSILVEMPRLNLSPADWPRFSLVTGLALSETLASFLPSVSVGLKWPNDVWLGQRKVCGILIEQSDRFPDRLVVGIGLNVNNSFDAAPEEQRQVATSMSDAAQGHQFDRTDILIDLLSRWRLLSQQLAEGEINLVERWSRTCVLTGHPVTLSSGKRETTGVCTGIDGDGALLLRTAFAVERHYAGTVRLLK
jgi:BirA family biotin operon repressor/biotin-[acetyl-CoA-carboxylase] ligase